MRVDSAEKVLEELKQKGIALIDEKPRSGAEGKRVAFISPKNTKGVLLELVEKL
jgi:translation elongation factor EF-Ts